MTYAALLILMLLILFVSLTLSRGDAVAPTVIVSAAFSLAVLCALLGVGDWNHVNMSSGNALIIFTAVLSFAMTSWVVRANLTCDIESGAHASAWWARLADSKIAMWKIVLLCAYVAVTYALYWHEIVNVNAFYGLEVTSMSDALGDYRSLTPMFSGEELEKDVSGVVLQMRKICDAIFIVSTFGLINGVVCGKGVSKRLLAVAALCAGGSLLTTGRSKLMAYVVAAVILWIFLRQRFRGKFGAKQYLRLGVAIGGAMVLFYGLLTVVGRQTSMSLLTYITSYLGYGIPSFDLMMLDLGHFGFTGIDIFAGLAKPFSILGIVDAVAPDPQYWVRFSSGASNIYTAVKDYYCVGGIFGVISIEIFFSMAFSFLYTKACRDSSPVWLMVYAMYGYVLVDQIRAETFFKNIVTINIVIYVIAIILVALFLFGGKERMQCEQKGDVTKG